MVLFYQILPGLNLEDMSFDDMFALFKSEPGKPSMLERLLDSGRVQGRLITLFIDVNLFDS